MFHFSALVALVLVAVPPVAPDTWACAPSGRSGLVTDPVVHPPEVTLEEIAARMPASGSRSFTVEERGRVGTVTHRDADALIVHRFEFSRGAGAGWQLERARSCAMAVG